MGPSVLWEEIMARTRRIKLDGDMNYHVMSRTNDRQFLFKSDSVKTELADALRRAAAFCGVALKAYAVMDNHFHAIVRVTKPRGPVGANELLRRVGILRGERAMHSLATRWAGLAAAGLDATLAAEQNRFRSRMHDVSEFVKLFKEEFNRAYKRGRRYCGSLWSGRFRSTMVEDGVCLARCIRYVVYNPVRAGIVTRAKDYRWSWCEDDAKDAAFAGAVPGEWHLKRVAQIGAGKVFGSLRFVAEMVLAQSTLFRPGICAHPVGTIGHSTHGWRLANTAA